jgi:hypothetical protein
VLDSPSVRDWAQDVMLSRDVANPGSHTLGAAGLLFTQASRHPNMHDDESQCEIRVAIEAPSDPRAGLPTFPPITVYVSVFKALHLLRARNKRTAIIKATDEVRMKKLEKEEMIVERCCTALQNVAYRVFKSLDVTKQLRRWDESLVRHFLRTWGSPPDIQDQLNSSLESR